MSPSFYVLLNWALTFIFMAFGILNWLYIDPKAGLFYLVLSLAYCPPLMLLARRSLDFGIPFWLRIVVAFAVLWASLVVGYLAELDGL